MNSAPQGSYQFENLIGREKEAAFLHERARMRLDGFTDLVKRHCKSIPKNVLEIGCGQGIRTELLASLFAQADVIGIDRSAELLESISNRASGNLSFQEADAYALPFGDNSFDLVYARLVFMHLNNPMKALAEIRRVLRHDGIVIIEDADRDCMFFEPAPVSFAKFWSAVQQGQRRLGGDPNVGRMLAPYLKQSNFSDVNVEAQPIIGDGAEIEFLARTLLPSLNYYLPPEDQERGHQAIEDLRVLARDPAATFCHFWFVVSAKKMEGTNERPI